MKSNCVYIHTFSLIYNCVKHSNTFSADSNSNKYSLYLFSKSDSKQNYVFKGCFSLFLNICSDDVFEVGCKNGTEFRLFIKRDDKKNNADTFFNTLEHQARSNPIESMKALESKGFVRFDGKIENGKLEKLVYVGQNAECNMVYTDNLSVEAKKQAWDDLLSKREIQNKIKKNYRQNNSLDDKIKVNNNQIQKESKPMLQSDFTNYIKE